MAAPKAAALPLGDAPTERVAVVGWRPAEKGAPPPFYPRFNPAARASRDDLRPRLSGSRPASGADAARSEEHTSELQSLMRISYAVFCLKKKTTTIRNAQNRMNY